MLSSIMILQKFSFTTLLIVYLTDYVAQGQTLSTNQPLTTDTDGPIEVTSVDFLARTNLHRHKTDRYSLNGRCLALRRGELFEFNIMLNRPYDPIKDRFRLEFSFGGSPSVIDQSLIHMPLVSVERLANLSQSIEFNKTKWEARILNYNKNQLNVQVNLPPNIPIGFWRLKISTKVANSTVMQTFSIRDTFCVLFNAWNTDDDVFLEDENARQEYLMNEIGKIYIGSYIAPAGRKWTYGQFDQSVLPTIFYLLDRTRLSVAERADVVKTSRAVSAIVNSHDEGGLLVGNWSGNYMDGLSPWQWTGSAIIFKRYIQNGYRPVKFGQCWVFGGMTTTTLRALGIPARTITNFVSAHDTDSSLTVDKFYNNGGEIREVNGDSIWNFHVWSDAWMRRRDLPPGFGGWQAIDATPQEQSMSAYQLGPASLEAIKQGKTGYAYDVNFVFSEVNADLVYWQLDGRSRLKWRKTRVQAGHVGRKILTKMIGLFDDRSRSQTLDAENIVDQYKYVEGTMESRKAFAEATRSAGLQPLFDNS